MIQVFLKDSKKGGHYAPGVISKGMLYISGQLPIDHSTGKLVSDNLEEQVKQTLHNVELVVKEAGLTKEDIVQCRIYTPDIKYWERIDTIYKDFFGNHMPARAVASTNDLHMGALIVIEAIAETKE
ncbi:MAG: RidA family protein [Tissierellaceae bacterium]|nr:RidA family protein [Tissierellaceae bacterium]